jgi:hypothetical protein
VKIPAHEARIIFNKLVTKGSMHNAGKLLMQGNCPLPGCGDKRRRFYMKDYGNDAIMVYCHNCGYSKSLYVFLKDNYPSELVFLKEIFIKSIKDGSAFKRKVEKATKAIRPHNEIDVKLRMYTKEHAFGINEVQTDEKLENFRQKTLEYFTKRRLSKRFVDDLSCFYKGPLKGYAGIPFYDDSGNNLIHIQGRRMFSVKTKDEETKNPKYKFLRDFEKGIEIENKPVYGTWKVKTDRDVMVVEGTLDADAFTNAVATCGATISDTFIQQIAERFPNRIWCPDSYWTDKAGKKLVIDLLNAGERCFIFPQDCTFKDGNQMIVESGIDKVPQEFINNNIYHGKLGLTKLRLLDMNMPNDLVNDTKETRYERQVENTRSDRA